MQLTLQKALFGLSSSLTAGSPRTGARLLDAAIKPLVSHRLLEAGFLRRNRAVLDRVGEPRTVLVLADIHLGDAVMLQGLVVAVRDFFPAAEIHYVVSRAARPFLEGHPDVSRLWPVYSGSPFPSEHDLAMVRELIATTGCDLIVNACPFFVPFRPFPKGNTVLNFLTHAPCLIRNEDDRTEPNHFLFQSHRFLSDLFIERWPCRRSGEIRGAQIFLSDGAVDEADAFVDSVPADRGASWVLLNPDGASPYTRPTEALLLVLLRRLVDGGAVVLIGEGHTDEGVGVRLRDALAPAARSRTHLVPASMTAPAYAALLDRMDAFVSGDTGPLHWGAARKVSRSGRRLFWNRTAVFSVFGATPARMSGYDSSQPGFLPAWQDAPSMAFESHPPCRNITCLNKLHKTCHTVRCFEGLSPVAVASAVCDRLGETWPIGIPEPHRVPA